MSNRSGYKGGRKGEPRVINHPHAWIPWGGDIDADWHASGWVYVKCAEPLCQAAERISADEWNRYEADLKAAEAAYQAKRKNTGTTRPLP